MMSADNSTMTDQAREKKNHAAQPNKQSSVLNGNMSDLYRADAVSTNIKVIFNDMR